MRGFTSEGFSGEYTYVTFTDLDFEIALAAYYLITENNKVIFDFLESGAREILTDYIPSPMDKSLRQETMF